jgi:hypothetical protein
MNELGCYGDTGSFEPMLKVRNEAFSDYLGSSRETWELLDSAFKPGGNYTVTLNMFPPEFLVLWRSGYTAKH